MEAIHLTSPRFDVDEINNCLYSADEVALVNKIAINYFRCEQNKKAIDIYEQLLKIVLKQTQNHKYIPLIASNYARYLGLENRLAEALEIAELGRQTCVKQEHYYLLPKFLHLKAMCYSLMGEDDRSAKLFQSAYHIYRATGNIGDLEALKVDAKDCLNLEFSL